MDLDPPRQPAVAAIDAGAPTALVLARLCLERLDEAEAAAVRMGDGSGDGEALHDLRVGLRRLRSLLRAYRALLPRAASGKVRRALRELAAATGEARDLEVHQAWLAALREGLSPAHRPALEALLGRVEARRGRAIRRIHDEALADLPGLRRRLLRRLAEDAEAAEDARDRSIEQPAPEVPDDGPAARFGDATARLLLASVEELLARIRLVRGARSEREAHAARIAAKRLRYLAEPLRGASDAEVADGARRMVAHLKELQDALGGLHDAHQLGHLVERALVGAAAAEARRAHRRVVASTRRPLGGAPDPRRGLLAIDRAVRLARDDCYRRFRELRRQGTLREVRDDVARLARRLGGRG